MVMTENLLSWESQPATTDPVCLISHNDLADLDSEFRNRNAR